MNTVKTVSATTTLNPEALACALGNYNKTLVGSSHLDPSKNGYAQQWANNGKREFESDDVTIDGDCGYVGDYPRHVIAYCGDNGWIYYYGENHDYPLFGVWSENGIRELSSGYQQYDLMTDAIDGFKSLDGKTHWRTAELLYTNGVPGDDYSLGHSTPDDEIRWVDMPNGSRVKIAIENGYTPREVILQRTHPEKQRVVKPATSRPFEGLKGLLAAQ